MNSILELYSGACDMFVRPGRSNYTVDMLGPSTFKLGNEYFIRQDFQVCSSQIITNNSIMIRYSILFL